MKTLIPGIKPIGIMILSLSYCACAANPAQSQIQPNQERAIYTGAGELNTVNIVDKNLQRTHSFKNGNTHTSGKIAVESMGIRSAATGVPELWVQLRNLTDYPQNILVRNTWYDDQKAPVDGPNAWTRLQLPQNGGEIYRTQSFSAYAKQFYTEIQEVR